MENLPKIGLFVSALLEDEWNKSGNLRPKAVKALDEMTEKLKRIGQIISPGLIETIQQAENARRYFIQEDVDLILVMQLCYTQGIIPLRTLLNIEFPILIWNSQLLKTLPIDAGWDTILVNSGVTGIPELTSALVRSGREFYFISGHFADQQAWQELREYAQAAHIKKLLTRAKVGIIGHPYKWMTDLMVDHLEVFNQFGVIVDYIEQFEFSRLMEQLKDDEEVNKLAEGLAARYNVQNLDKQIYLRSVRYALSVEKVVTEHKVDGLAFFEQGLLDEPAVGITGALGMSRLFTEKVPCSSESDLLTVIMMLIQQYIAGSSTFLEHYGMDFEHNAALMAHDSFGNVELADEESSVVIEPSIFYKGSAGYGAALRFSYKPGDVTLSSLCIAPPNAENKFRILTSEGTSEVFTPRPIPAPQMLFRPNLGDINTFYHKWCTSGGPHHLAGCYGHYNSVLRKLAELINIDCYIIC